MKRIIKKVLIAVLLFILLMWLISWGKCEILTVMHGKDFKNAVSDGVQLGDDLKILYYSEEYAEVYYKGVRYDLLTFRNIEGEWFVNSHRVVKYGNDSFSRIFIWPYFWDYII